MSSIRSASSRIRISTLLKSTNFFFLKSINRPGVQTRTSTRPLLQLFLLLQIIYSAKQRKRPARNIHSKVVRIFVYLHDKFPRGGENQRARSAERPFPFNRMLKEVAENCNKKCCGLSRSGLSLGGNIVAGKCFGKRLCLNRRAVLKFQVIDCVKNFRREVEIVESFFPLNGGDRKNRTIPGLRRSSGRR